MFSLRFAILIIPSLLILSTLCVAQGVMEIIRPPGTSPQGAAPAANSLWEVSQLGLLAPQEKLPRRVSAGTASKKSNLIFRSPSSFMR
ncbi:hypothetical protein B9Z19DRAFT_1085133 [Tuber borchii]|uniref:Uncharacterized protein n=1 Tax=Tuber borchii TaxID=42251 RepID=A0A2T6ZR36_TUBBO|nr:hypothetical protein B9Z19DRAFT_1085133 [Tuber borchii]